MLTILNNIQNPTPLVSPIWSSARGARNSFTQDAFGLAISPSLRGQKLPYWRPTSQPSLNAGSATATLAIMVHHGAARNAENYTSYMTNGVINAGLSLNDVFIVGPQVKWWTSEWV